MALQVWMPLTKDTRNLGLSGALPTANNATYSSTGGKLGGCYTFDGSDDYIASNHTCYFYGTACSLAMWIYPTSYNRGIAGANLYLWQLFLDGSGYLGFNLWSPGGSDSLYATTSDTVSLNTWTHIAVVSNGTTITLYLNGVSKATGTDKLGSCVTNLKFNIGGNVYMSNKGGSSYFAGKLNDFRVYNHALSSQEVKDLSKALIGGWLGNDWQVLRSKCSSVKFNLLVSNGDFSNGTTGWSSANGSNVTLSVSNNILTAAVKTATYKGRISYSCGFTANHKYFYSFDYYGGYSVTNEALFLIRSNPNVALSTNAANGKWLHYEGILTPTTAASSFDLFSSSATLTGVAVGDYCKYKNINIIDLTAMFGSGSEPSAEDFRTMFPMQYYPYTPVPSTTSDLRLPIPDALSGLHNDLTVNGTVSLNSDTKRYDRSMYFNGSSYLSCANPFAGQTTTQEWTVSAWVKPTALGSSTYLNNFAIGNYLSVNSSYQPLLYLNSGTNDYYTYASGLTLNKWIHICFVFKNSTGRREVWKNGSNISTSGPNKTSTPTAMASTMTFLLNFTGYASDIRVYATALSEADIKELASLGTPD